MMGMFLQFLGGAAKRFSEGIEESEKEAKINAMNGVKAMRDRYVKVQEENRTLEKKLNEDKEFILAYHPKATPDQINELLARPTVMEAFKKYKNPGSINLDSLVTISQANVSDKSAAEKVTVLPEIVEKARSMIAPTMPKRPSPLGRVYDEFAGRAFESAQEQTAAALGTSMSELTSQQRLQRPTARGTVDMSLFFTEKKTFAQREDEAKVALLDAQDSGDDAKIMAARAGMKAVEAVKSEMTPAQTKFANKVADIKQRYMFGTPEERKAAKPEYDKLLADVRAEAAAKKTGEGKEEKIPALSTLNTFTSAAVARRVAEVHGDLVRSKQLAIIEKADGSSSLEYTGDNPEIRAQINRTAFDAAKNALSLYITPQGEPMTRDVAAVLNTYTAPRRPAAEQSPPTPAVSAVPKPAAPQAAAIREFKSVAEAEAAKLPKGTRVKINGRPAEIQ